MKQHAQIMRSRQQRRQPAQYGPDRNPNGQQLQPVTACAIQQQLFLVPTISLIKIFALENNAD
jgi:hypothetical protein